MIIFLHLRILKRKKNSQNSHQDETYVYYFVFFGLFQNKTTGCTTVHCFYAIRKVAKCVAIPNTIVDIVFIDF